MKAPSRLTQSQREALWGYLFIAPWIIGFIAFSLGPIAATIYLAFTKYNVIKSPVWTGLRNFTNLFTRDEKFLHSLVVTVEYLVSDPLSV